MSAPVSAEPEVMDLVIGGSGSVPWTISNIAPGDNGSEVVELKNAGRIDGYVTIWFSDVVETDGGTDGAKLGEHFLLTPISEGLSSSLSFPASFDSMPRSESDRSIVIGPLAAGESVNLTWAWEFFDNGAPQNEAQGDSLSFTINYLMTSTGPEDGVSWLVIDVLGELTVVALNATGYVQEGFRAGNENGTIYLDFPAGCQILTENGILPEWLIFSEEDLENILQGTNATGLSGAFLLKALEENGAETNASFSSGVTLTIGFDPFLLPEGSVPGIYQLADDAWMKLNGSGPFYTWYAYAEIGGTGIFAAGAYDDQDEQPLLQIDRLDLQGRKQVYWWNVLPLFIKHNYQATIEVEVCNIGNATGNFTVELTLDGKIVRTASISLDPGQSGNVTFHMDEIDKGNHLVSVGGMEKQFRTYTWINWPLIWAIAIISILAALVVYAVHRKNES